MWFFVVVFSGLAIYCVARAFIGVIDGDWLSATWLLPAVVTSAGTVKVVSDFRRYGRDSPRFSWRALLARNRED